MALRNEAIQDLKVIGELDLYPVFLSEVIVASDSIQWHRISYTFEADDNYEHLILGNFSSDQSIEFKIEKDGLDHGYYLVDDVLLKPLFDKQRTEFIPNKTIVLKDLLFEYDKAIILESSFSQLNKLVGYLRSNPDYKIEIKGHTDAKGNTDYNLTLSQNRADAIKRYLIENGIDAIYIKSIGVGSDFPIIDNLTEENRQMNRRVEIKLTEQ